MPSLISLPMNFYSVIMASRRSRDKTPDTDNQIVKNEPASPLNIVNRFTTLGTIPKPNYSSVLASTYDSYALTNVHQPVQTIFPRNPNAYGFLSTKKRMCNTILKFYNTRIQSLSRP